MPKRKSVLVEILCLVLAVFVIWLWANTPTLSAYNLYLTAFLVIIYFVIRRTYLLYDFTIFTGLLLLLLASTDGLASSFFFLTYFLLFGIGLLFDPIVTLTLTLSLTLFFAGSLNSFNSILQVFSLILMTPLAVYFGKQYLRLLESKNKIKILVKERKILSEAVEKEETAALLWLSLDFKDSLLTIIHRSAELLSDLGHLTLNQKEHLEKIHDAAKDLLKSGEKLQKQIDKQTD